MYKIFENIKNFQIIIWLFGKQEDDFDSRQIPTRQDWQRLGRENEKLLNRSRIVNPEMMPGILRSIETCYEQAAKSKE